MSFQVCVHEDSCVWFGGIEEYGKAFLFLLSPGSLVDAILTLQSRFGSNDHPIIHLPCLLLLYHRPVLLSRHHQSRSYNAFLILSTFYKLAYI